MKYTQSEKNLYIQMINVISSTGMYYKHGNSDLQAYYDVLFRVGSLTDSKN